MSFFFLSNLCLATFLDHNSPLLISSIKEGGRAWTNDIVSEAKIILLFVHETILHDAHNCCVVYFQGSPPLMRRMAFRSSILVMYIHRLRKKRILHALLANVAAKFTVTFAIISMLNLTSDKSRRNSSNHAQLTEASNSENPSRRFYGLCTEKGQAPVEQGKVIGLIRTNERFR